MKMRTRFLMMLGLMVMALLFTYQPMTQAQTETPTAPTFPEPGSYTAKEDIGGRPRSYRIYIPPGYPEAEAPVPLIVVMHGAGGTGKDMEQISDFNTLADRDTFIVVYPDGISTAWNDGRPSENEIDDVGFITHIVDYMLGAVNIDPARVYMTGYSMGGMMAYRMGCMLPDQVAAIASVASTFPRYQREECQDTPALPVLLIHGTFDEIIPWGGSIPYFSAGSTIEWWVKHNECVELPDLTEEFDANPEDPIRVRRETFNQCADNSEVTIYGAIGGGHTWPGHLINAPFELGITPVDIDATEVIWEFFQRHPASEE